MSLKQKSSEELSLIERAAKVLPAGSFGNFASDIIIRNGQGARVWDISGNEYVDFLMGSGPMFLGHNHPVVQKAVAAQLHLGTTFFTNNEKGIELAEKICAGVACADQVRFVSSGTEADMYAMRLAQAHRKRDKILKFEGGYHGMSDYALMSVAPKELTNFPKATPDSAGISKHVRDNVIVSPFNDIEQARRIISKNSNDLAGVIVEPFQRLIPPIPGFLEALREETTKHSIPLIFDEVVTGFRFAYGGAQEVYGVVPDLCTLGKIIGGGFPLAAIAGRDELMSHFDIDKVGSEGFTYQVGTLSGNPIAAAAGLATLEILSQPGTYERVHRNGKQIMVALHNNLREAGLKARVVGHPTLFDVFFLEGDVINYRDVARSNSFLLQKFNRLLRERGILKPESKFYLSLAHGEKEISDTVSAIESASLELLSYA